MRLSKEQIKEKIKEIVTRSLTVPHYKVFLFGSRVTGEANNRSDFDIGILAEKEIPAAIKMDIDEELNKLPLLQKFEVVDFNQVSEDFKEFALQKIELIYEK